MNIEFTARRLDRVYRETQQRADKPFPPLEIRIVEDAERPRWCRAPVCCRRLACRAVV